MSSNIYLSLFGMWQLLKPTAKASQPSSPKTIETMAKPRDSDIGVNLAAVEPKPLLSGPNITRLSRVIHPHTRLLSPEAASKLEIETGIANLASHILGKLSEKDTEFNSLHKNLKDLDLLLVEKALAHAFLLLAKSENYNAARLPLNLMDESNNSTARENILTLAAKLNLLLSTDFYESIHWSTIGADNLQQFLKTMPQGTLIKNLLNMKERLANAETVIYPSLLERSDIKEVIEKLFTVYEKKPHQIPAILWSMVANIGETTNTIKDFFTIEQCASLFRMIPNPTQKKVREQLTRFLTFVANLFPTDQVQGFFNDLLQEEESVTTPSLFYQYAVFASKNELGITDNLYEAFLRLKKPVNIWKASFGLSQVDDGKEKILKAIQKQSNSSEPFILYTLCAVQDGNKQFGDLTEVMRLLLSKHRNLFEDLEIIEKSREKDHWLANAIELSASQLLLKQIDINTAIDWLRTESEKPEASERNQVLIDNITGLMVKAFEKQELEIDDNQIPGLKINPENLPVLKGMFPDPSEKYYTTAT